MNLNDKIRETENRLNKLKEIRSEKSKFNPTLKDFHKLIMVRFSDCLDALPLDKFDMTNKRRNTYYEVYDIHTVLMLLFSFYAGRIFEDADQTGLFKGPAIHRCHTILTKYVTDCFNSLKYRPYGTPIKYLRAKREMFNDLNGLGRSKIK